MNYLFRWSVLGEKFPSFDNPVNYCNVLALRIGTDEANLVNHESLKDKHILLCLLVGFVSRKSEWIKYLSSHIFAHSTCGTQKHIITGYKDNWNYFPRGLH